MEFDFFKLFQDEVFMCFLIFCHTVAFIVWIITLITDNHSIMDKLWPLLPIVYSWGFLATSFFFNPTKASTLKTYITDINGSSEIRLLLLTIFITIWGIRLANYFWRRG
jgi:steroid 5-alpha reductase family enzyme